MNQKEVHPENEIRIASPLKNLFWLTIGGIGAYLLFDSKNINKNKKPKTTTYEERESLRKKFKDLLRTSAETLKIVRKTNPNSTSNTRNPFSQ